MDKKVIPIDDLSLTHSQKRVSFSLSDGDAGTAIAKQATQFLDGDDMLDPQTSTAFVYALQKMLKDSKPKRTVSRGLTRRNTPNRFNQCISHMKQVEERLKGLDTVVLLAALLAAVGVEAQGGLDDVDDFLGHASMFCFHSGIMTTLTVTIVVTCISVHTRRCFDLSKSITGALHLLDELAWMFQIAYKFSVAGCGLIMLGLTLLTCIRDENVVIIILNCMATMACGVAVMWSLKVIFQKQQEASIPRPKYYMVKYDQVPKDSVMLIAKNDDDEDNYQLFSRSWEKYCRFLYILHCDNPNQNSCILANISPSALSWIKEYVRDKAYKQRHSNIKETAKFTNLEEILNPEDYDAVGELPFDEFMDILNAAVELEMNELLEVLQCVFATRCYLLKRREIQAIFSEGEWQIGKHAGKIRRFQSMHEGAKVEEIMGGEYFEKLVEKGLDDSDMEEEESKILTILLHSSDSSNTRILDYIKDNYKNFYEDLNAEFPEEFWKPTCEKISIYHEKCTISSKAFSLCDYTGIPDKEGVLQVKQVSRKILKHIFKYLNHHNGKAPAEIAKPIRSIHMHEICEDAWDARYVDDLATKKRTLFQVILAANYLACKPLLHLCCAKVACMIKGKSPEEIKQILGEEDENDISDEEDSSSLEEEREAGVVETPMVPTTNKEDSKEI